MEPARGGERGGRREREGEGDLGEEGGERGGGGGEVGFEEEGLGGEEAEVVVGEEGVGGGGSGGDEGEEVSEGLGVVVVEGIFGFFVTAFLGGGFGRGVSRSSGENHGCTVWSDQ